MTYRRLRPWIIDPGQTPAARLTKHGGLSWQKFYCLGYPALEGQETEQRVRQTRERIRNQAVRNDAETMRTHRTGCLHQVHRRKAGDCKKLEQTCHNYDLHLVRRPQLGIQDRHAADDSEQAVNTPPITASIARQTVRQ